jgi:hypothetical protein
MFGETNLFRATSRCGIHADEQYPDNYFYSWEYDKITCKKCLSVHLKKQQSKREIFIEGRERYIREQRRLLASVRKTLKAVEKNVPREIAEAKADIKPVKARMDSYQWEDRSTMGGKR